MVCCVVMLQNLCQKGAQVPGLRCRHHSQQETTEDWHGSCFSVDQRQLCRQSWPRSVRWPLLWFTACAYRYCNLATGWWWGMQTSIFCASRKPRNTGVVAGKASSLKPWGDTEIILDVVCVAAGSQLVWSSVRESQQLTRSHSKSRVTGAKVIRSTEEDSDDSGVNVSSCFWYQLTRLILD